LFQALGGGWWNRIDVAEYKHEGWNRYSTRRKSRKWSVRPGETRCPGADRLLAPAASRLPRGWRVRLPSLRRQVSDQASQALIISAEISIYVKMQNIFIIGLR
jgi:hypothetical protein